MAKNKVSEWSATPANNTDVGGIDIAEGCAPSGINNAIREIMSQVKDMQAGTDGDNFSVGGNLVVTGTTTFTGGLATDLPIADGGTGASTASDARTNLGLGTIATQAASNVSITGGSITGITDLAVADGGTGRSALTANNLLLGNGTSGVNFVAPSTSGNLLESNGTTWSSVANKYVGVSQTWQSFTGSRAFGTSYQNTTGKPIMASLSITGGSSSAVATVQVSTDNVTWVSIATMRAQSDQDVNGDSFSWIIPNGHYYKAIVTANSPSIVTWAELR